VDEGRTIVDREERWAQLGSAAEAMERRARRHLRKRGRHALAGIDRLLSEA
jgi:Uri superfamily endonuclease